MAQNFKSKDLTISIPEKGEEQIHPTRTACLCSQITNPCLGFTFCGFSPICHIFSMCHGHSPIISPGTCTTTIPHCTPTPCTVSVDPTFGGDINEISKVTDVETLNALKEKLANALKEVETQQTKAAKAK
jgi:hypothetical protein